MYIDFALFIFVQVSEDNTEHCLGFCWLVGFVVIIYFTFVWLPNQNEYINTSNDMNMVYLWAAAPAFICFTNRKYTIFTI